MISFQERESSVFIAIQFRATLWARVPAHAQIFRHDGATPAAFLRAIVWGHFCDNAASFFRFACT
jgi:hypothetical protein